MQFYVRRRTRCEFIWYTKFYYITSPAIENSTSLLLFSTQSIYQGGRSSILIRYNFVSFLLSTFHAIFCVYAGCDLMKGTHMNRRRNVKFCQLSTLAILSCYFFYWKVFFIICFYHSSYMSHIFTLSSTPYVWYLHRNYSYPAVNVSTLHSSVGIATHRCRGGHGLKSCCSLGLFLG